MINNSRNIVFLKLSIVKFLYTYNILQVIIFILDYNINLNVKNILIQIKMF